MGRRTKLALFLSLPRLWGRDEQSSLWGGAKRRVGLRHTHTHERPPTLHIVRAAHDLLSLPTSGRDEDRRFRDARTFVLAPICFSLAPQASEACSFLSLPFFMGETSDGSPLLIPPTFVGRVAHRERCERCDGWGLLPQARYQRSWFGDYPPPGASPQVGGIRKRAVLNSKFSNSQTNRTDLRDLAAHVRASFGSCEAHLKIRGRRECRALDAPAASHAK
jgi:hypothetical protein